MKQEMQKYTSESQLVWKTLFQRQVENIKDKACTEYQICLSKMKPVLHAEEIPDFKQIDDWFKNETGWQIEVVPGLIPVRDFFNLLSQKKFCSSTWLRSMDQLDYLEEPDMFHDIFGHIPLLSHPEFSEFTQTFGKLGCKHMDDEKALIKLQRLYWFTIEFGLIQEEKPKAYGAGIISSYGELNRISKHDCSLLEFDIEQIINKFFETDVMQEEYFLIDSYTQLKESLSLVENLIQRN